MWRALRADLQEFVSTVTEDTSNVLSRMDDTFPSLNYSAEEQEALRRMKLVETYTSPLLKNTDNVNDSNDEEEEEDDEETRKIIEEYLESFNIEEQTLQIAAELEKYADSLQPMMEELVPMQVSYTDFWQRYFYRCSVERIQDEWARAEERERQERSKAVTSSLLGVRSFLDGAVQVVSTKLTNADEATSNEQSFSAGGFFGTGRPPFVMNTAVDEDDEDNGQGDEEEELGWDDDEEEEHGGNEGNEEDERSEQIEFNDLATEKLQEQLKQALEERDLLHQTIELQTKEIAYLKSTNLTGDVNEDIKKFQMQLFEKESELAAMKAAKLDASHDHSHPDDSMEHADVVEALQMEKKGLLSSLAAKDSLLVEMKSEMTKLAQELKHMTEALDANKLELRKALERNAELEAKGSSQDTTSCSKSDDEMVALLASSKSENESLRQRLELSSNHSKTFEAEAANSQIVTLKAELENTISQLAEANTNLENLKIELSATKATLDEKNAHIDTHDDDIAGESHDSPDTNSTGVKIEVIPKGVKHSGEDEEEEDWGDDW